MVAAAGRVRFDFAGSLTLARKLWALADHVQSLRGARQVDANLALESWEGRYATEFRSRIETELASLGNVAEGLRAEARAWAWSWKKAMDEQNRRNRAGHVDAVRARRSWLEANVGDRLLGDDSDAQVAAAPTAPLPQPPGFQPTCAEMRY